MNMHTLGNKILYNAGCGDKVYVVLSRLVAVLARGWLTVKCRVHTLTYVGRAAAISVQLPVAFYRQ